MLNTKMADTISVETIPKTLKAVPNAPNAANKFRSVKQFANLVVRTYVKDTCEMI
jgi:hypothetical protein